MTAPPSLTWAIESGLPGVSWPALPAPGAAQLLALLFQLERTQWLDAGALRELQLRQLSNVLRHAVATVPFYRERYSGRWPAADPLTWDVFSGLPLLTRQDLQTAGASLTSSAPVARHGPAAEARTSGSTGTPVRVLRTALDGLFWNAFTLRDHAWQRRHLGGKLCAIRQGMAEGQDDNWGAATRDIVRTGPAATFPVGRDVAEQLHWLQAQQPEYLLSHPTNVAALARLSIVQGIRLPGLREVRTSGEMLDPGVRDLCREAWDVPVIDMYSTNEVGYIALQCPDGQQYHAMAEGLLVEVLDDAGRACAPGETGRVVVTSLHNFAMPLIRYVIGDYAETGPPCSCGRGLPVLARILGRVRNMLVLPSGERYWPSFSVRAMSKKIPLVQHQFVQKEIDLIEARLVVSGSLLPEQENWLVGHLRSRLPPGFRVEVVYCTEIPRGAGGKFEDFISNIA